MIPSLTGIKLGSLHGDVGQGGLFILWLNVMSEFSAVARGGARGARAPPVFFLKSKNRPV